MLSRVAENIFWMNRYLERADNNARFLIVNFNLALDLNPRISEQWKPLVQATGTQELFDRMYDEASQKNVVRFMAFDEENPSSIYSCVKSVRENARSIREKISGEIWEQVNELYFLLKEEAGRKNAAQQDPRLFFTQVKNACQTICGMSDSGAVRNEAWYFAEIGKYIERADNTSRILDVRYHIHLPTLDTALDLIHWAALLRSVGSYNSYRQEYGTVSPAHIVDYLTKNPALPRSLYFCTERVGRAVYELIGSDEPSAAEIELLTAVRLLSEGLKETRTDEIIRTGLHQYLDQTQLRLIELTNLVYKAYFLMRKD